jgi:hypothetical protein
MRFFGGGAATPSACNGWPATYFDFLIFFFFFLPTPILIRGGVGNPWPFVGGQPPICFLFFFFYSMFFFFLKN